MAHYDLEEQEQLAELKAFWAKFGSWITAVMLVAALGVLGWNGWQYWQNHQIKEAAQYYDQIDQAIQTKRYDTLSAQLAKMQQDYPKTGMTTLASFLVADALSQHAKKPAEAKAALVWVSQHGVDEGYVALAKLRLAGLASEAQAWDEALQHLSGSFPSAFAPLIADRKGDVYKNKGDVEMAKKHYLEAWEKLDTPQMRPFLSAKLAHVGVVAPEKKDAQSTP